MHAADESEMNLMSSSKSKEAGIFILLSGRAALVESLALLLPCTQ
jgi:hypothetical protein